MKLLKLYLTLSILMLAFVAFSQDTECKNPNHQKSVDIYLKGLEQSLQGNKVGAISYFKQSIELDPNCPGIFQQYRDIVYCYVGLNDYENALFYLNEGIPLTKNDNVKSELYSLKGSIFFQSNDFVNCVKICTEAVRYDKENYTSYYFRAMSKYMLEDYKSAFYDFSIIISEYESTFYVSDELNDLEKQVMELHRIQFQNIIGNTYLYSGAILLLNDELTNACKYWSKAGEVGSADAYKFISKYCN